MIWVTAEDVVAIHSRIIQVSGGIDGLRDRAGLEAAIAAPLQSFGGEDLFPTDIEKIARIGFGLASNHAFIDGNSELAPWSRNCYSNGMDISSNWSRMSWPICSLVLRMAERTKRSFGIGSTPILNNGRVASRNNVRQPFVRGGSGWN